MAEVLRTSFFILVISILVQCYDDIPEGFSIEVFRYCGPSLEANEPVVSIITDLSGAGAIAHCQNGDFDFIPYDGIFLDIYPALSNSKFYCNFDKFNNSNTYVLRVTLFWGDMAGTIDTHDREYVITCNYDKKGSLQSGETLIDDPLMAPKEIANHMGDPTTSDLSLDLVNVRNDVLSGSIQLERFVRLIASTDGSNGEVGIKPVSCDAVGTQSGARHAIIRAGCGDGSVFTRESGFTTDGLKAYSPYFGAFRVQGDDSVDFECNLTLCAKNCDGSSCKNERRKRSELDHDSQNSRKVYFIKTKPFIYEKISDIEFEDTSVKLENEMPSQIGMKTMLFDFSSNQEEYVSRRQMWILVFVLGFLVFLALLASMYNCVSDIKPRDRCKLDIEQVQTKGTCKARRAVDKPLPDAEPLTDISIITTSYCPCPYNLPVNKV